MFLEAAAAGFQFMLPPLCGQEGLSTRLAAAAENTASQMLTGHANRGGRQ